MSMKAIGIACKKIENSLRFYELLGLKFEKFGEGHYEAKTQQGIRIMLDSHELLKEINNEWKEPVTPGITLCFEQESSNDVDQIFDKIIKAGYQKEKKPWDAFWGQRYASVRDPDGNQIDIFAQL
ncbi:VOC family protein [Halobacteriovorax sp. XZX-3]|uniref:VOC family protein n=1 Tax=unclassified Halobacteriovorax TaxID=2639665 RepID=UPI00371AAB21